MTPEEFIEEGEALFGRRWKAPLSRSLGLDPVTIWRYATGQWPVPVLVELAIHGLKHRRQSLGRRRPSRSGH